MVSDARLGEMIAAIASDLEGLPNREGGWLEDSLGCLRELAALREGAKVKWISVDERKPPTGEIKLLNVLWTVGRQSGDANDFGFYSEAYEGGEWWHFDKNRTSIEFNHPNSSQYVTHWSEQPTPPTQRRILDADGEEG